MTRVASVNGAVVAPDHATISIYDRGFLYGHGVFETMRVYNGHVFALQEHLERLARSAAVLKIPLPIGEVEWSREITAVVASSAEREAVVRVVLTRGASDGSPSLSVHGEMVTTRIAMVEPLPPIDRATYATGLSAVTLVWPRDESPASLSKRLGYATSFLALEEARARGAADAIFVEPPHVREATTSNVFVVRDDGILATPGDGPGVLGGITRSHVLDVASALGISCSVTRVATTELQRAREVFLTSTIRELAPVVTIDGKPVGAGTPGEVTRIVHRAYRARAGASSPPPWE